jgi:hypothetical protein
MSRDKRGVVNPVVGGSSPPATANEIVLKGSNNRQLKVAL